ncbi:MAG: hydrogenase formation protein HypD [Candidatus Omnitrophota bacterium]|nr:MAG: hydrogenase formation protein HypD [Candidatus Omnitrophota bacterium]
MVYENLLRDKRAIRELIRRIESLKITRDVNIMEVCGTHTYTFFRFGLRKIMPSFVNLISGPGCPVCITEDIFIDKAILLAQEKKNVIATFGDLVRVKGTRSSLEQERAKGAHILVVYSPYEALDYARTHPEKRVIFLGVGFETTAPVIASVVKKAKEKKLKNFFLLTSHRLIPPAMQTLCEDKDIKIDGFICPGHVSAIIGQRPYESIVKRYRKGCVICGFEPFDMVLGIYLLLLQIKNNRPKMENEYKRVVNPRGNPLAEKLLREVFKVVDAPWRGFGIVRKSGLALHERYQDLDAHQLIRRNIHFERRKSEGCLCAEVVKGKIGPSQCPQFRKICTPQDPLGPCMISFEGTCRIYYEYGE